MGEPRTFPWPAPFVAISVLAYALLALTPSVDLSSPWLAGTVVLNIALLVAMWIVPWHRLPLWALAVPPLLFLVVIAGLREAAGATSGYSPLVIVPVVWLGLYGRLPEIVVASVAAGAVVLAPALAHDELTGSILRASLLFAVLSLVVGLAIRRQVKATAHASTRLQQLQALDLNESVVQHLTRAQLALEVDDVPQAQSAIQVALGSAKQIVTRIIRSTDVAVVPGSFRIQDD